MGAILMSEALEDPVASKAHGEVVDPTRTGTNGQRTTYLRICLQESTALGVVEGKGRWWILAWRVPLMVARMATTLQMTLRSKCRRMIVLLRFSSSAKPPKHLLSLHRLSCHALQVLTLYADSHIHQSPIHLHPHEQSLPQSTTPQDMTNSGVLYILSALQHSSQASSSCISIPTYLQASAP